MSILTGQLSLIDSGGSLRKSPVEFGGGPHGQSDWKCERKKSTLIAVVAATRYASVTLFIMREIALRLSLSSDDCRGLVNNGKRKIFAQGLLSQK